MDHQDHTSHSSLIAREGLPFIILSFLPAVILFFVGFWIAGGVFLGLTAFIIWFFRNPRRNTPDYEKLLIAPADGRVLKLEELSHAPHFAGPCKKVSIFMTVFNVHVNRMPCAGRVESIHYVKGKFLSANLDKASTDNERNIVKLRTENGREILVVQVAGLIARRIVCWVSEGSQVQRGERFGLIRFGSCVEVYLPVDCNLAVKVGDKVTAGETPIGYLE
ncbi:MAG: phosphatidylserine decarboxylase family protein [Syntrophobacterales bacterium]|nr:phosphatidylserine decarboxylase family protein [Syntrophobacterales bacterium]